MVVGGKAKFRLILGVPEYILAIRLPVRWFIGYKSVIISNLFS